jgi:hypothetical protein
VGVRRYVPVWAIQLTVGLVLVLLAVGLFAALIGTVVRGPTAFFDELGKTVSRVAPQPRSDIRSNDELKALIRAMPDGKLRVGSIIEEQDRVVFTVTADRSAVRATIRPGDQLRIGGSGEVEIVPTGIPGVIDDLGRKLEELRKRFFGK